MNTINQQLPMDILERTSCIVDYMASSIATKEVSALIEQAGAFIILSDVSDKIKDAMEYISVHTRIVNAVLAEAMEQGIIDERFDRLLCTRLCEAGV